MYGTSIGRKPASHRRNDDPTGINISLFKIMVKYWKDLESIIDCSSRLDLPTHLLEATNCKQVTSIDVSFTGYDQNNGDKRERMRALIKNIHNAPLLEKVVFRDVSVRLADIEYIHNACPKLKLVKLNSVSINANDTGTPADLEPAKLSSQSQCLYAMLKH